MRRSVGDTSPQGKELMDTQALAPPPVPRTWWQRNWKWVVPTGILGGLAALACFVGLILLFVFGMFRGSDAYRDAMVQVRADRSVVRELGEPIQAGWWVSGSINVSGPSGSADFETPLQGPSGRGTLYVTAEKKAGQWHYTVLEVAVEGKSERINLLKDVNGI
jgi:Cytochrome oxidase complex assembly protein 1